MTETPALLPDGRTTEPTGKQRLTPIALDPAIWEVDRIELVDDRETFHWWINGNSYGGVVPVSLDDDGSVNTLAMSFALRRMIEASRDEPGEGKRSHG